MTDKQAADRVFIVGTLIDGTGQAPLSEASLVVKGDRIAWVGPKTRLPAEYKNSPATNLADSTAIPGLVDSHTHVFLMGDRTFLNAHLVYKVARVIHNLAAELDMGVTTIRDLGTSVGNFDIYTREAINAGLISGPSMYTSGDAIRMTAGMPPQSAMGVGIDGPHEARKAARLQLGAGADLLKIFATEGVGYSRLNRLLAMPVHMRAPLPTAPGVGGRPQMTIEEMTAVVEEAHKVEVTVACHAIETVGIKNALKAGIDTLEHGTGMDREAVDMMAAQGTMYVPTMSILHTIAYHGERFEYPESHMESARRWYDRLGAAIGLAKRAGIKMATGTDSLNDDTITMECARLIEAGLTPMEAIVAATRHGAELVRKQDEFGTLEAGKRADIVILAQNPLDDINALDKVQYVVKDGKLVREPNPNGPGVKRVDG